MFSVVLTYHCHRSSALLFVFDTVYVINGPRQANLVLIAYASSESRGTFRQKARSLAPLKGWASAVKICDDGMLEDTYSLDGAQMTFWSGIFISCSSSMLSMDLLFRTYVSFKQLILMCRSNIYI